LPWGTAAWASRGPHRRVHAQPYARPRHGAHVADETTRVVVGSGDPITMCLASMGRCDGGWVCGTLQMAQDLADHLTLRDDGDEPQRPALAKGTRGHLHAKDPLEQPRPTPARRCGARLQLVKTLLTWGWEDRPTEVAVRRQTAAIAHQMHVRQGARGRPASPGVPAARAECPWCRPTTDA
jgi:hypothetical protein